MRSVFVLLLLLVATLPCMAQMPSPCSTPNITFSWTLSTSESQSPNLVTGYQIWGATTPGSEVISSTPMATVGKGVTSVTVPTPAVPGTYYFKATAALAGPVYSTMSNEVSCSVGPAPPTGLGIK
jgi:hypothetical protein